MRLPNSSSHLLHLFNFLHRQFRDIYVSRMGLAAASGCTPRVLHRPVDQQVGAEDGQQREQMKVSRGRRSRGGWSLSLWVVDVYFGQDEDGEDGVGEDVRVAGSHVDLLHQVFQGPRALLLKAAQQEKKKEKKRKRWITYCLYIFCGRDEVVWGWMGVGEEGSVRGIG